MSLYSLSVLLHPFLLGGSLCVCCWAETASARRQSPVRQMQGYISPEAGLDFKDPGQVLKLASFTSYGLLSGKFCCAITADSVSQ